MNLAAAQLENRAAIDVEAEALMDTDVGRSRDGLVHALESRRVAEVDRAVVVVVAARRAAGGAVVIAAVAVDLVAVVAGLSGILHSVAAEGAVLAAGLPWTAHPGAGRIAG